MALVVWKGIVVTPRFHPIYAGGSMLKSRFHKTILQSTQLDECPSLSTEFQAPAPELMEAPCSRTVENKTEQHLSLASTLGNSACRALNLATMKFVYYP